MAIIVSTIVQDFLTLGVGVVVNPAGYPDKAEENAVDFENAVRNGSNTPERKDYWGGPRR